MWDKESLSYSPSSDSQYLYFIFVVFCFFFINKQLNADSGGMYRVIYPSDMLEALIPAIRELSLLPKDRLSLQSDLFALVGISHWHSAVVLYGSWFFIFFWWGGGGSEGNFAWNRSFYIVTGHCRSFFLLCERKTLQRWKVLFHDVSPGIKF